MTDLWDIPDSLLDKPRAFDLHIDSSVALIGTDKGYQLHGFVLQVLQAKTKVANGKVFDLAVKLSQGDMPDQIMQVTTDQLYQSSMLCCHVRHSGLREYWMHIYQSWCQGI